MSRVIALAILLACGSAGATPADRVLLADPDPELLHAVQSTLEPWHLAVIVDAAVPADDASAQVRAQALGARFVVWRERDQLVVFSRETATSEHRPARAGAFDPVTAAAAALTVKTMMRLPPPEAAGAPVVSAPIVGTAPATTGGPEVRIEAGIAGRLAAGDGGASARATFAAMVRPWTDRGWRLGVRADLGTSAQVARGGFKGTWSDWAVLAGASWTHVHGAWELEPWAAAGVTRATLDGTDTSMSRTEHALLGAIRGGIYGRRRFGAFSAGLDLELAGVVNAPTYVRATSGMGMPTVFESPSFSLVIALVVAADLGR